MSSEMGRYKSYLKSYGQNRASNIYICIYVSQHLGENRGRKKEGCDTCMLSSVKMAK